MKALLIFLLAVDTFLFTGCVVGEDEVPPPDDVFATAPGPTVTPTCNPNDGNREVALRCYTCQTVCSGTALPAYCGAGTWPQKSEKCLKADAFSGGTAYRWYEAGADDPTAHQEYVRPFILLDYMRKLRNAAASYSTYTPMLENQIEYLIAHSKTLSSDGPTSTVWQSKKGSSTFADGLNQAAYTMYFLSLAKQYQGKTTPRDYFQLALQFDNAMERPAGSGTGGIRRVGANCGASGQTGACWYFHSRAPENTSTPGTALNQSLYVIRVASEQLVELDSSGWTSWPSAIDRSAWSDRLRDRISNGMTQWAYGAGNTSAAPSEPPNLVQHERRKGTSYYWADYDFDMANHVGLVTGTHTHMCNYHTVTINNLGILLDNIDTGGSAAKLLGSRAARIAQAKKQLVTYTRSGGVIEATGVAASTNPLYQWFVAEVTPSIRETQEGCPKAGSKDSKGVATEALYGQAKDYLCAAYAGTTNPALTAACK